MALDGDGLRIVRAFSTLEIDDGMRVEGPERDLPRKKAIVRDNNAASRVLQQDVDPVGT